MKLRMFNDSVRLRLRQSEVKQFADTGLVQATIHFGPTEFKYTLLAEPNLTHPTASLYDNHIAIAVPTAVAEAWTQTDQVSIAHQQKGLAILIEKDYQCLHKEDDSEADAYPNPNPNPLLRV